ncbi:MAG: DUF2304 domain-containing protein [Acidimicrobiales bacterium]|jgi:hypothetical protein|nr:DUF2304 domain-containing protein [Acidimicrobiales bacterium]
MNELFAAAAGSTAEELSAEGGLTTSAHVFIAVATAVAVFFVLRLLRQRQLRGKYAMLWTASILVLGILAIFPGLLETVSDWVGVYYPPAFFLLVATGFLLVVVVQFSWELSRLEDRTRTLAEEVALLRAERDLERLDAPDE